MRTRMDRYLTPDHPLCKVYRVGAALFGTGLIVFGGLGFANQLAFLSTNGRQILGLSSNGLLSLISLVVAQRELPCDWLGRACLRRAAAASTLAIAPRTPAAVVMPLASRKAAGVRQCNLAPARRRRKSALTSGRVFRYPRRQPSFQAYGPVR